LFKQAAQYVLSDASSPAADRTDRSGWQVHHRGAVEAARKLVEQDEVDVVLGPTQIGQKNAVATYCAEKQVPMVLYNPTPPGALEDNEWVLGVGA